MRTLVQGAVIAALVLGSGVARAQDIDDAGLVYWGFTADRLEYRFGDEEDVIAVEADAFVGTDKFKARLESEVEYGVDEEAFERQRHQLVGQIPISPFFDAKAGIGINAPEGPDRWYGIVGLHGLAPQWFELDADFLVSETGDAAIEFEAEYEALITNRIILVPSVEFDFGFTDDEEIGAGQWLRSVELGARLSYDLIDRAVAPYVGVHYERLFGETADLAKAEGGDRDALSAVVGVRLMF